MTTENRLDQNPYEAPAAALEESALEPEASDLAPRWRRLLANVVDIGLPVLAWWGVEYMKTGRFIPPTDDAIGTFNGLLAAMATFGLVAINAIWLKLEGQTIGKRIFGIKLVRSDRSTRLTLRRIFLLRFLPLLLISKYASQWLVSFDLWRYVPPIAVVIGLSAVTIVFPGRRCVHDYLADTVVVRAS